MNARWIWLACGLLLVTAAPIRAADLSILQDLYGYWSLDANDSAAWAGKFRDDGTLLHPAIWQFTADADQGKGYQPELVPGIRRQAVRLRGKERPFAFDVPLPTGSPRRLTVSLWAWMDERRDDEVLFANTALERFGYGEFRFRVLADGITVHFGVYDPDDVSAFLGPSQAMATHTPFPLRKWAHVALVIDEPDARLYLNAREIGRLRLTRPLQKAVITAVTFGDCRRRWAVDDVLEHDATHLNPDWVDWTPPQPWSGRIDEVAMWTRPLTAAEVRGVFAATLAGKPVFDAVPINTLWESTPFQTGAGVLAVLIMGWLIHRLFTRRLRFRLTTAETLLSVDAERKRIADDIHDELGARLAKLSLLSEMAARNDEQSPERLQRVSETARDVARSLDELVWTLKPSHDSLNDFASYLSNAASELLEDTGISLRLNIPDELPDLKIHAKVRRELLLVWKEATANAMKHANATEIAITISLNDRDMVLTVADNGVGLPNASELEAKREIGNGLRTMCERIARLGGKCEIENKVGGGTIVAFSIGLSGHGSSF